MVTTDIPLPTFDWSNENKNNVEEMQKHNYILLNTGPKALEIVNNVWLTAEQKKTVNVFKIF